MEIYMSFLKPRKMIKTIRDTILICFVLGFIVGCGTKKRAVHIERGVEIVKEDKNIVSEETSIKISIDTSKVKTKTSEESYGGIVEKWVWGENGNPVSYTKTTINKGNVVTETEELKGLTADSLSTSKITDLSVLAKEVSSEVIDDNLEKETSPPSAWIGWGMILGTILGLGLALWIGIRLFRKF